MKKIKVEIEETDRTDLLCLRCGGFRAEFVVHGSEHVGVHKRCLREARPEAVRRRRSAVAEPAPTTLPVEAPGES